MLVLNYCIGLFVTSGRVPMACRTGGTRNPEAFDESQRARKTLKRQAKRRVLPSTPSSSRAYVVTGSYPWFATTLYRLGTADRMSPEEKFGAVDSLQHAVQGFTTVGETVLSSTVETRNAPLK